MCIIVNDTGGVKAMKYLGTIRYSLSEHHVSQWLWAAVVLALLVVSPASAFSNDSSKTELMALAEKGDAAAQNNLGIMYEKGLGGVKPDYSEAMKWYRLAEEQGNTSALYNIGQMYDKGIGLLPDHAEAVKWFRKSAELGNANAEFVLGGFYTVGNGVPKDYSEAFKWLHKSAEQCNPKAQFWLGMMYHYGYGVPENYEEAMELYDKAADQGNADVEYGLATMYKKGLGVPIDYVKAYMWFDLAATQHHTDAIRFRDALEKIMNPEQIAEAKSLVREWNSSHLTQKPLDMSQCIPAISASPQ
jgi:uncharacterized protein